MEPVDGGLQWETLTGEIIGAAMEVHRGLGLGFLEKVYEEALAYELDLRGVAYTRQVELPIHYKGRMVKYYVADMVVDGKVVVEIKAMQKMAGLERAQVINYLKATGLAVGLLLNFGTRSLDYQRVVFSHQD